MKQILLLLSLVLFQTALSAQVKTAGVNYSAGAPAWTPSVNTGSELAIDTVSKRIYLWNRNTATWDIQGQGIDNTSGGTPPAYTPGQTDSKFAINNANPPELYAWTGSAWAKVGGTVQTIDTFSVSGQTLSVSLSSDGQPARTVTLPAGGITALTGDVTATGPGSVAATIANGAVTAAKLASMGASAGQVLGYSGSAWGPVAAGWGLSGNAATAGSSFLGTTNLVSLRFRTNNVQRMVLDSLGNVGIGTNAPAARLHLAGANNGESILFTGSGVGGPTLILDATNATTSNRYTGIGLRSGGVDQWAVQLRVGSGKLHFFDNVNNTNRMQLTTTGIYMGGANTDATIGNSILTVLHAGQVGIGTTTPGHRLVVHGSGSTSATWTAQFHNSTGTNNALIVRDDGNIGMGTSTPPNPLTVTGNVYIGANNAASARLHVRAASSASSGNALQVQNSTPSILYNIRNDGQVSYWATNTATGTTGAQTIDRPSGTVNIAAGQSTIVVTNSLVTTASIVFPVIRTNDTTATIKNVVAAAGSFTITLTAAATAETSVGFLVIN